jgi:hypothetical protein
MLNFRRKQIIAQNQIEKMVKAKAELECTVTEKDQQLNSIKEKLYMKNIQQEDQSHYLNNSANNGMVSSETAILNHLRKREELERKESFSGSKTESSDIIMIDAKDPDRPRFTLKELQKVLMEKNQLTVKLDQTKDELEQLRKQ